MPLRSPPNNDRDEADRMMTTASNLPGQDLAMAGPHVVVLIDLLGQSSELAKWDFVPNTVKETATWVPAARNTIGRVLKWREEFERLHSTYLKSLQEFEEQLAPREPVDVRKSFDEYRQTSIHFQHFSDTLIIYSPLQNEHDYWQVSNIDGMLHTCGALMLAALHDKTVFRGAIEVGMLIRFPNGEPYGPALAKAHHLESKVAGHPRILVGPGVLSYLDWIKDRPEHDGAAEANRGAAMSCQNCITKDTDGCSIVDYLNDEFANYGNDPAIWRKIQADTFPFIVSELDRFKKENNQQLAERYERLAAYFRSRGSS